METPNKGIGAHSDIESVEPADGSVIALLKRIRTLQAAPAGLTDLQLRAASLNVKSAAGESVSMKGIAAAVHVRASDWEGVYNLFSLLNTVVVAPALGAVISSTGPLPAGTYDFDIGLAVLEPIAIGKGLIIEHRNALDSATVRVLGGCAAGASLDFSRRGYALLLNERIRVIAGGVAGAAGSQYVAAIIARVSPA